MACFATEFSSARLRRVYDGALRMIPAPLTCWRQWRRDRPQLRTTQLSSVKPQNCVGEEETIVTVLSHCFGVACYVAMENMKIHTYPNSHSYAYPFTWTYVTFYVMHTQSQGLVIVTWVLLSHSLLHRRHLPSLGAAGTVWITCQPQSLAAQSGAVLLSHESESQTRGWEQRGS